MPIVVVAAGYAAYQYYENKRQNSQLNLAAGDGGGETETEKDASKAAPAPAAGAAAVSPANEEARDDEHGDAADKEPHDGDGDDDKTEESSSGSLDDDESSGCESSSSSAPAAGAAEGDGANAPAKPPPTPTLLQQWNEKYPGQQQQKGQRRNRWSARLRRNFDGWRSASAPPQPPPSSASSSSSSDPSSSAAGAGKTATAPASGGATGSVYPEVREALAIRDSSQEKEETEEDKDPGDCPPDLPTPAPASASRTETKQGPLNALRRNLTEWRSPAPKGSVYPEAWEILGFRDSSQDEEKKIAMEPGDCPPEPLTPASAPATQSEPKMGPLGALRRNFTEWRTAPSEDGVYPEAWEALGFRDPSQVEKQEKQDSDCPPPAKLPTPALATQSEKKLSRLEALRRNFFERRTTPPEGGSYPEVWTALGFRESSQEEEEEKEKSGDCPPAEVPTPAPAAQSETQPGPPTATKADPKAGPLAALRRNFCEWRAPSSSSLRPEMGAAAPVAGGKTDEGAGAGVEEERPESSTGGDACYDEVWDFLGGASRLAKLPPTSDIAPTAGDDVGVEEPLTAGVYAEVWGVLFDHCGTSS